MVINKRFNRVETPSDHYYHAVYDSEPLKKNFTTGWIKCKLVHGDRYSVIVPDQIFIDHDGLKWIQPLAFLPNINSNFSEAEIFCELCVYISCGHTLIVRFFNRDLVNNLPDGSQLYKCQIQGPKDLHEYATGEAELPKSNIPYLRLYHHTTNDAQAKILASSHFRTSSFNIQGVNKQFKNAAYVYFTPLDKIVNDGDLKRIAMAEDGTIPLKRDGFAQPVAFFPDWQERYKDDILVLPVYRCDPAKREACIDVLVDSSALAPQHIYRHDIGSSVFYEITNYFVHRVGAEPGRSVEFDGTRRIEQQSGLKRFDYLVVGDCTTLDGLAAPYDEEDTTQIMKIERITDGKSMLNFWFDHGNQDLYTPKTVELQSFHKPGGSDADPKST